MILKRKILNRTLILSSVLFSLASCKGDISYKTFKGYDCIVKDMGASENRWYPKTTLGVHINITQKDYYIEYFIEVGHYEKSYRSTNWVLEGINVKFTSSDNTIYISEGSYSLFTDKCLLH